MLEKNEYRMFSGNKGNQLYLPICDFWAKQGFSVSRMSPYRIQGETYDSKVGLKRRFVINMYEQEGNTYLDLEIRAKATDLGVVGGVVVAVVCWPIALIGGAISYSKYDSDVGDYTQSFWQYMDIVSNAQAANAPTGGA